MDHNTTDAEDWDGFLVDAKAKLASGRVGERVTFLQQDLKAVIVKSALTPSKTSEITKLLLPLLSRYSDTPSREAVLVPLRALLQHEHDHLSPDDPGSGSNVESGRKSIIPALSKYLEGETDKLTTRGAGQVAPATRFAVLGWWVVLFPFVGNDESASGWENMVRSVSKLVDGLLDEENVKSDKVGRATVVLVRRCFRENPSAIPSLVHTLISLKPEASAPAFVHATLLGLTLDVAARLRNPKGQQDVARSVVDGVKDQVTTYYIEKVLSSKIVPPPRVLTAFTSFLHFTTPPPSAFLPTLSSSISKTPEAGLTVSSSLFSVLPADEDVRKTLVPLLLPHTKSLAAPVRAASVKLFEALFTAPAPPATSATFVPPSTSTIPPPPTFEEIEPILTLFKTGKTSSPDHRTTLWALLTLLIPSPAISPSIVTTALPLLGKETNELTYNALLKVLTIHLPFVLSLPASQSPSTKIPPAQYAPLTKGMGETKVPLRRSAHLAVGNIILAIDDKEPTEEAKEFVQALVPGFEMALKTVGANPLNCPAGPLEAYVAVAVLDRARGWAVSKVDEVVGANPTLATLLTVTGTTKPSFLLWDKVYKKLSTIEEEEWFQRALEAVLARERDKVTGAGAKDAALRSAFAAAIVHLAVESEHHERRGEVVGFVRRWNEREPEAANRVLREGIVGWLIAAEKTKATAKPVTVTDETVVPADNTPRLRPLLTALATFSTVSPPSEDTRQDLLVSLLVIAHHPNLGGVWTGLVLAAGLDPSELVGLKQAQLLELIWKEASPTPESPLFAEAAYRAATTLAFVSPSTVVPAIVAQLRDDLDVKRLEFIGSTEYGIWATPEGVPFVDVLAPTKPKAQALKKNAKEYEAEKWEAELREALARKKPAVASLSKQDRALVEKQLAKEQGIRVEMASALGRLRRGFQLLLCLVKSGTEILGEYLAGLVKDMLAVVVLRPATLVAQEAFSTFLSLADICSERLGQSKLALGVAVLRGVDAEVIPESYTAEPLDAIVTRVLHRLRFFAEQSPFDAGTFAYAAPLVSKVLRNGGLGVPKAEQEAVLEQLTLALDFIAFHSRQCSDVAFPRLTMIGDLLATLLAFPSLSRTATGALADLTDAIKESSTAEEIAAILDGAMTEEAYVRFACLQALSPLDLTDLEFPPSLWIAAHDIDERNSQLAATAWQENALDVPEDFLSKLILYLAHASSAIRKATAKAIAEGIDIHPSQTSLALGKLVSEYHERAKLLLPQYDQFGMIIEESLTAEDPWRTRVAIASTLNLISTHFSPTEVTGFFNLLIEGQALGDRSQSVRSEMLDAAVAVIDHHGKENLQSLIAIFETYLAKPSGDEIQDFITESLVILFGRLARHLEPTDPRVAKVIARLVEALKTPSEVVQIAVCDCLPALVKDMGDELPPLVDQLLSDLFQAPKYAERRGAAYGLAGIVRGRGLTSLKEFGVLGRLQDNVEDKKSTEARQGAVFGYEILATVLGRLFEPYVSEILPLLLTSFGDTSTSVRQATSDAAKAIMSKLSGYAVKVILPTLLSGLDDKQWRAKKGAIELMGAMAFLAPKQLSVSLPTIIPRLTEVLTDTHKQVRESANTSLKRFGEVVTNPEIQAMQSTLLDALVDPSKKTPKALDALLSTTFAHFIDSSSLALIIPILDRGLRERSADIKRKASAIVGNMATLTAAEDIIPYLSQLVPLLRGVLIDPVPEARSTAAKSLGGLVERLGENNFPDLMDTLMAVLKSPSSGVDQQGAAQGVSEILAGLGTERLEGVLPTILANTSSPRAYVREGHISLLVFLPATFGERFSPYLGRIIQPVLSGLADDSDFVREASMRAGRMIVANHSTKAIDLLLPELELGMFDVSWRIRQSSVQLVGELLFRITGITGKPDADDEGEEDEEDNGLATETSKKALVDTLGRERRDRVLAALYIVRQDSVGAVRQAAIQVWKALVQNTPRTVREMLPVLMQIIVRTLASPGIEQRETAARCLADTCRRLGEAVLGEVVGILQKAMASQERRQREGVCLALTEIMQNTNESSLEAHESAVISIVRTALVDQDPSVRTAAAQAFDVAQQVIGARSIDETIPTLLDALQQPGDTADAALEALKEVMSVRADKIFPILIPRLIATPITAFNARALASLVRVAGSALGRRLTNIVDSLQQAVETEKDEETLAGVDEALTAVLASVEDHESGLGSIQMHLLGLAKSETPKKRIVGCQLFTRFCQATEADFSDYVVDWVRQLVPMFDDPVPEVIGEAWIALDSLVKTIDKEDMEPLVVPLRRTIESTGTVGVACEGFSRPNGLKPILPILLQGLLAGTAEQREQAAFALGDLVERTSPEAFKAYCIQTVGPLIRVIGDRFAAPIKSAILSTLTIFLTRVPQFVKPFFPQLQRTFVKSITDASSNAVRNRGAAALGVLMLHQPRVDPLITELANLTSTEEGDVRESIVTGLANVVQSGGKNLSEGSKSTVMDVISEAFAESNHKETFNIAIGKLTAAVAVHDTELIEPVLRNYVLSLDIPPTSLASITLRAVVDLAPQSLYDLNLVPETLFSVLRNVAPGTAPAIARPGRDTKDLMREREPFASDEMILSKLV
ncbi:ARM repeat-containing protein [Meredithblackwellia eburnea MCA 4105]